MSEYLEGVTEPVNSADTRAKTLSKDQPADTGAPDLESRWRSLNAWLQQHASLWRPSPFTDPDPAWTRTCPALADWLCRLDDDQCERYDKDLEALAGAVAGWLPGLADYSAVIAVPDLSAGGTLRADATLAEKDARDMPGRKRQQAGALVASLAPFEHELLDWCCGKGHLARTLARSAGRAVTGFEWNPELVSDGNRLVRRHGEPVFLACQNVMAEDLAWPEQVHGVALHACGDLHRKLIRDAVGLKQPRLSLSPCCYHLRQEQEVIPLSARARGAENLLQLERSELRLAVQETVTAPSRVRAQGVLGRQWRLGFDGLQRQLRGVDRYLNLPTHPPALLDQGFQAFCGWAAQRKGLTLPAGIDYGYWLDYGMMRWRQVRRFELLRHLFRRPMELWLVLDYALFLEEAGYEVRLGTFCERGLTPRNLLLDAIRKV